MLKTTLSGVHRSRLKKISLHNKKYAKENILFIYIFCKMYLCILKHNCTIHKDNITN